MNETKWTPGPWFVENNARITAAGKTLAYVVNQTTYNAEMMAAAPELYDALNGMVAYYKESTHDAVPMAIHNNRCPICIAMDVMAKARGEK